MYVVTSVCPIMVSLYYTGTCGLDDGHNMGQSALLNDPKIRNCKGKLTCPQAYKAPTIIDVPWKKRKAWGIISSDNERRGKCQMKGC